MKRGQVTQFIIAGLIILIAIIFIMSARLDYVKDLFEQQKTKFVGVSSDIKPVEEYVQSCLNEIAPLSNSAVLIQGGYYEPNNYIGIDIANVALWYDKGKDVSPSLKFIESEIGKVVDVLINSCIKEFYMEGYGLSINNINTNVKISENNILMQSFVDVDVNYKDLNFSIKKKFNDKQDSDLYSIYGAGRAIIDLEVRNPDSIELTTLSKFGYDINFFRYNEDEMVYTIKTKNTNLFIGSKF